MLGDDGADGPVGSHLEDEGSFRRAGGDGQLSRSSSASSLGSSAPLETRPRLVVRADDASGRLAAEARRRELRVGLFEFVHLVANRVYFSKAYAVLYGVMVVLNVVMLIWLVMNGGEAVSESFLGLEIFVTVLLGLEVLTRIMTQGTKYCRRYSNWFEFVVLCLCTLSIVMTSRHRSLSVSEEMDELLSWALLVARYVIQGLRLLALLRHRKRIRELGLSHSSYVKTRRTSSTEIIDFDAIVDDEDLDLDFDGDTLEVPSDFAYERDGLSLSLELSSVPAHKADRPQTVRDIERARVLATSPFRTVSNFGGASSLGLGRALSTRAAV